MAVFTVTLREELGGVGADEFRADVLLELREDLLRDGEPPEEVRPEVDFEAVLAGLHPRDQDLLILRYREGMMEKQIGAIMDLTQPAISYALSQSRRRFAYEMRKLALGLTPALVHERMKQGLQVLRTRRWKDEDIEMYARIVAEVFRVPSQNEAGRTCGVNQGRVRFTLYRTRDKWLPVLVQQDAEAYGPVLAAQHLYWAEGVSLAPIKTPWREEKAGAALREAAAARARARWETEGGFGPKPAGSKSPR